MKFFIPLPYSNNEQQLEEIYLSIKSFMITQGFTPTEKKIRKIEYVHNEKQCSDCVGENCCINKEPVIVILECETYYLTCTPNRGFLRGEPIITGKHYDTCVTFFD